MPSLSKTESVARPNVGLVDLGTLRQCGPVLLRLIVGYGFIMHGYAKFARGPETFAVVLHTLGVPMPFLFAWLTTLVELIGGFAILIGAFVPIVSGPLAVVLLAALFTIHLRYGLFSVKLVQVTDSGTKFGTVGYEIILLYLASLATLVLGGPGPLSVDQWRSSRRVITGVEEYLVVRSAVPLVIPSIRPTRTPG